MLYFFLFSIFALCYVVSYEVRFDNIFLEKLDGEFIVEVVQEVLEIIFLGKLESELMRKSCTRSYHESYANKIFR